jgi:Asp-tRNA(Asn)/Glu-tRNA(Gln) amidotransferase A subunit family amidase
MSESMKRRTFFRYGSALGLGSTLFPEALSARMQPGSPATLEAVREGAKLAGLELSEEELQAMVEGVEKNLARARDVRRHSLPNDVPLPLYFDPRVPGDPTPLPDGSVFRPSQPPRLERPGDLEEVAFWPLTHLAELVRTRRLSSVELTQMYLARIERYEPILNSVVTVTKDLALSQARRADAEIASGRYLGPLHGIPWGAKDIISARGYPTMWGASLFEKQILDVDAAVVERLSSAGAVLLAKLSTGELAFGDQWFRGRTNSPWNPEEGSSGSSAGSGAATAAGLVGFSIGTDTGGSILAPSVRCGVVGMRPTFGRVSRYGVMAAGFSLDRIGPMCRTAEDCALVLRAIAGGDSRDLSARDVPVAWDAGRALSTLRVGYTKELFDRETDPESRTNDGQALDVLRSLGLELKPVALPESDVNFFIEYVERGAGFDEFSRSGLDAGLVRTRHRAELRVAHLVPAVDYLQANRLRYRLMREVAAALEEVDVLVTLRPTLDSRTSVNPITSLTGHPAVAVPNGFTAKGTPTGFVFVGQLYREDEILLLAKAYQDRTGFYRRKPQLSA